jgi:FKBP-type peptidyl-prolyl cis-trans isomerase
MAGYVSTEALSARDPAGMLRPNTLARPRRDATRAARLRAARLHVEPLEGRRMLAAVDLAIAITDGREVFEPGRPAITTIVVTNAGPDTATAARVSSPLPTIAGGGNWTASYSPGATGPASGTGGIDATVTLPSGGSAIFTNVVTIPVAATGRLVSRATVTAAAGDVDSNPTNDSAVDVDTLPILVAAQDAAPQGRPVVSVIDPFTGAVRHRFLAYERGFRGGVQVAVADVDRDGVDEIVTASGSGRVAEVRVFRPDGTELTAFRARPYGGAYRGGIEVAAGDIDGDGDDDIVTTLSRGAGDVRVLRSEGTRAVLAAGKSFRPFADDFRGGATVAVADLDGDRKGEIVVGSGVGTTPRVLVYSVTGSPRVVDSFRPFAADPGFAGGVSVSVARHDADGVPDILVAGGRGAGSATEVYDGRIDAAVANARIDRQAVFAGFSRANAAVSQAAVDLDGDGRADRVFSAQGTGGSFAGVKAAAVDARTTLTAFTSPGLKASLRLAASAARHDATLVTTPTGLQYRDLAVGTGATAAAGSKLRVHYVGTYPNGTVFDSSRDRRGGVPFEFTLGADEVIDGWDEGLVGLRVGDRRQLIVPENLAYKGQAGRPAGTLVFHVELLGII